MNCSPSLLLRLPSLLAVPLLGVVALACSSSSTAHPVSEPSNTRLWDEYVAAPDRHPNIPNCSYAGYRYGEEPIPDLKGPLFDVTVYGAVGDGEADDTVAIRAAIAAAGPSGGVVWFPDGKYKVSGVLFVHTSNTVLRGQSQDGVELIFTQPLERAWRSASYPARTRHGYATKWNYAGGLVWFAPESRGNTYLPEGEAINDPKRRLPPEGWNFAGPELVVSSPALRGDREIRVQNQGHTIAAGDLIGLVQRDPQDYSLLKHLAGGGAWADAYDWKNGPRGAAWPNPQPLLWPVEVSAVVETGDEVVLTLRQPLRFDLREEWSPRIRRIGDVIRESGIENLTMRFLRDFDWSSEASHHIDQGWSGPFFNNALHCWLRDVTLIDMENGINLAAAKCVTATRFTLKASSADRLTHHHGTTTRGRSCDNLFSDFRIESRPVHGLNVEGYSAGNVWMRGTLVHGIFDTHRLMPFDSIRTDITLVNNDGYHGGNGGPLMGARFVNWNVRVESGTPYIVAWANAMPSGALVGLQGVEPVWDGQSDRTPVGKFSLCRIENPGAVPIPANLYEAQLRLRLGRD